MKVDELSFFKYRKAIIKKTIDQELQNYTDRSSVFLDIKLSDDIVKQFFINIDLIKSIHKEKLKVFVDPMNWPIAPKSVDMLILEDILERSSFPYKLLAEAVKTLDVNGKIIITGFNPFSLLSLYKFFSPKIKKSFVNYHFISIAKIKNWLILLGLKIEKLNYISKLYPLNSTQTNTILIDFLDNNSWFYGGYIIIASLDKHEEAPIQLIWKQQLDSSYDPVVNMKINFKKNINE